MSGLLSQLCIVPGVAGAAVFDHRGVCLEQRALSERWPLDALSSLVEDLVVGLEAFAYLDQASFRLGIAHFGDGIVVVMRTADHRAVALASKDTDHSMLEVAFGALEVKLRHASSLPSVNTRAASGSPALIRSRSTIPADAPTADRVPEQMVEQLREALADAVGPIARVLLQEHCARLGVSEYDLPNGLWPALLERLSAEIVNEADRRAFQRRLTAAP